MTTKITNAYLVSANISMHKDASNYKVTLTFNDYEEANKIMSVVLDPSIQDFEEPEPKVVYRDREPAWQPPPEIRRVYALPDDAYKARKIVAYMLKEGEITGRIDAIKLLRNLTGLGLKESKDFVENNCDFG